MLSGFVCFLEPPLRFLKRILIRETLPTERASTPAVEDGMLGRRTNTWTIEEDRLIRELADRGVTEQRIALKLRRTRSAIRNRAKRLDVTFKEQPAAVERTLVKHGIVHSRCVAPFLQQTIINEPCDRFCSIERAGSLQILRGGFGSLTPQCFPFAVSQLAMSAFA